MILGHQTSSTENRKTKTEQILANDEIQIFSYAHNFCDRTDTIIIAAKNQINIAHAHNKFVISKYRLFLPFICKAYKVSFYIFQVQ